VWVASVRIAGAWVAGARVLAPQGRVSTPTRWTTKLIQREGSIAANTAAPTQSTGKEAGGPAGTTGATLLEDISAGRS
jgi:hypothetical protein